MRKISLLLLLFKKGGREGGKKEKPILGVFSTRGGGGGEENWFAVGHCLFFHLALHDQNDEGRKGGGKVKKKGKNLVTERCSPATGEANG